MGCQDTWCVLCGGPLGGYAASAETVRDQVLDDEVAGSPEFRRRYPVEVRLRAAAAWLDQVTALTSAGGVVHGLTETACNGQFEDWPQRTKRFVWAINDARWDQKEKRYIFGPEGCIPVHTDCYVFAEQMGAHLTFADLLPIFPFGFSEPSGSSLPEVRSIDYYPTIKYHGQMFDDADSDKLWEHPEDWHIVYSPLDAVPSNAAWVKKNRARIHGIVKAVVAAAKAPPKSTLAAMAMSPTQLKQLAAKKAAARRGSVKKPKKTSAKKLAKKTSAKKPSVKKPSAKKLAKKPSAKKLAKKPATKKASAKKPSTKKRPERPSPTVSATMFPLRTRRKKGGVTYEVVGYKRQNKLIKRWQKVVNA